MLLLYVTPAFADKNLAEALSEISEVSHEQASEQIKDVFLAIEQQLENTGKVQVRSYGTFYLQNRKARTARNPKTGEAIKVPAKSYPKFRSSDSFKKRLNPTKS